MNDLTDYYHHKPEKWTVEQCRKAVKKFFSDGLGTPYPMPGMIPHIKNGPVRYNGGTSLYDKWYQGEVYSLPILPKQFKWEYVPTWCWRIVTVKQSQ